MDASPVYLNPVMFWGPPGMSQVYMGKPEPAGLLCDEYHSPKLLDIKPNINYYQNDIIMI
jgi:hypothetical protein